MTGLLAAASVRGRPRVALVGPHPDAHGGVAGSIRALLESPLVRGYELIPVVTHRDGTRGRKLVSAVQGLLRLWRLCHSHRVDLVHVNSSWNASIVRKSAAVWIAHRCGVPVVLQLHGSGFQSGLPGETVRTSLARRAAQTADAVVAATPAWAAEAAQLLGVDSVRVIPNAASVPEPPEPTQDGAPTILFLGRIERAKGVFELVEAAAAVAPSHPGLRLVLAGRGRDDAALRSLVRDRGLDAVVDLPGWVDGEAKLRLLASARCFVLPSHAEGLPLALLEAMGSGLPVVATRVGGIPEAVRNGREALLVAPGDVAALRDAIVRILDDQELAGRLSKAARARARAYFDAEYVAAELAGVYEQLLEPCPDARRGERAPTPSSSVIKGALRP